MKLLRRVIYIKIAELLKDNNPKYVDIIVGESIDEKRFLDMYTIIHINKNHEGYEYKDRIINKVRTYFEEVLEAVKLNDKEKIQYLSKNIHEARYTNLGYSVSGSGKGFGKDKFTYLLDSLRKSDAYNSGTISDILDVELYVDNIGVDIISDLVTNLIQDILSEYTYKKLECLNMLVNIVHSDIHYWDEVSRTWGSKKMPVVFYDDKESNKIYNYLLVPYDYTADENQKEYIVKKIFDECIYKLYEKKIFSNPVKYESYIHEYKNGDQVVFKKKVAKLINQELGEGSAKEGSSYITGKGLLGLIEHYEDIKKFIELEIKN
ncbi:hypothetical protein PN398_14010 [Romboutsia sp. 1001216sp1]|uniref:hypothetical protein n=1 Tax=Romboutsia sp. 1001216sp1 TaxID=2986997 RepID=UPI002330D135|nr:hypothetical protein [Romboutsia sp. 1001216sp1]MDB8791836.1 hypothetical protein [Romboutsia sp. 1001216sp1]